MMSSFGGAVQAMREALTRNKNLLGERKKYFRNRKEYLEDGLRTKHFEEEFVDHIQADPKLLREIEETFLKKRKKQRRLNIIYTALAVCLAVGGVYIHQLYSQKNDQAHEALLQKQTTQNNHSKYLFYIQEGDQWFDQGNFYNAIFQYKKSLALFPNRLEAHYRLCLGYSYGCRYDEKGCEEGKQALEEALALFPDNEDLLQLRRFYNQY